MSNLFNKNEMTVEILQENWRDPYLLWWSLGMPSFDQQDKSPWKQIVIKFKTKEDREHFSNLFEYNLTEKTNAVWYPKKNRDPNSLSRYMEDGFEMEILEENEELDDDES